MNTQRTHAIPSDATAHAQILAGRYQIEGVLGRGSMATVYRAVDLHTRTACAVKTLNGNYALSEDAKRRFIREAEIISRIEHPHIVKQIDLCFSNEGAPILAMELLEGEDLASLLSRRTVLPVQEALPIAFQVADALAALHQHGVLHRDLKPWNFPLLNLPKFLRGEFRGKAAQLIPNYFGSVNKKSSTELLGVGSKSVTSIVIFHSPSIIGFHAESQDTCVVV